VKKSFAPCAISGTLSSLNTSFVPVLSPFGKVFYRQEKKVITFEVVLIKFFGEIKFSIGQLPRILKQLSLEVFSCDSQVVSTTCFFLCLREAADWGADHLVSGANIRV
jgi:hypothetical protein